MSPPLRVLCLSNMWPGPADPDYGSFVADMCGALGIDLEGAVARKMAFNATRPYRHGNRRA